MKESARAPHRRREQGRWRRAESPARRL